MKTNKEINKEIIQALRYGYSVKRIIHKGWTEQQKKKLKNE